MLSRYLIVYILLLFLSKANAQHYYVKPYTITDGLPNDNVQSIFLDSRGYLWISTDGGLSRFDGKTFINYDQLDGLNSPLGGCIYFEDSTGKLWISEREGVCTFDGQAFKRYPIEKSPLVWVNEIVQQPNNKVWFETQLGVYELKDTIWKRVNFFPQKPLTHFHRVINLDDGSLLFNLWDSLVIRYKDGHSRTIAYTNNTIKEFYLLTKTGNHIYASSWNHLWLLQNENLILLHDDMLANKSIRAIFEDKSGKLWIGTEGNGFYIFDDNKSAHYDFVHDKIYGANCFCEDNEGNVWVGTEGAGLIKVKNSFIDFFYADDKSKLSMVTSAFKESNGNVLFGTKINSYSEWNGSKLTGHNNIINQNISSRAGDWILKEGMAKDAQNRLWFATIFHRLFRMQNGKAEDVTDKFGITDLVQSILYNPNDSNIYLSVPEGLQQISKNDTYTIDSIAHPLLSPIDCLSMDSLKNIWMTQGKNNIWIKNKNGMQEVHNQLGITDVHSTKLCFSSATTLWIATDGKGVYRYQLNDKKLWTQNLHITRNDELPDNVVMDIVCDKKNKLWVASASGLASVNFNNADTGRIFSITHYRKEDGFDVPVSLYPTLTCDNDGNVWYGTDNFLARIRCNEMKDDTVPPRIQIEGVQLFSKNTNWKKYTTNFSSFFQLPMNPVIPYDENDVSFQFNAISFSYAENATYSYQLTRVDKQWTDGGKNTHVTYANLPPGKYTFYVRAKKPQSSWSYETAAFAFTITPPYWQTWWFYTLCAIAFTFFLFAIYRYRLQQVLKLQTIRNKISGDLHDDIGSTLNSISVYSEVAKQDESKHAHALEMIGDASRKIIDAMSDIVWTINPENDSFENIILRMRSLAFNLLRAKNIEFTFRADESLNSLKLSMENRRNFFLIFKEAINNIVKYAEATGVSIQLMRDESLIKLIIRDNGRGFDTARVANGNGLNNMKRRAKEMKAQIKIASSKNNGTNIELILKS